MDIVTIRKGIMSLPVSADLIKNFKVVIYDSFYRDSTVEDNDDKVYAYGYGFTLEAAFIHALQNGYAIDEFEPDLVSAYELETLYCNGIYYDRREVETDIKLCWIDSQALLTKFEDIHKMLIAQRQERRNKKADIAKQDERKGN